MDLHGPEEFVNPVLVLPPGIAECDGILRAKWHPRAVTLQNEAVLDVANGVCQNIDPNVVLDMDGRPLGDDRVVVQIAESLCEEEVPCAWMWSIHSWNIRHVFLDGVSLYDHDQTNIYNMAVNALTRRVRKGVRSYETTHERLEPNVPPKKESLLTVEAITHVSTKTCCESNCLQPFPRGQIQALRAQFHVKIEVYNQKRCLLDVHGQIHKDPSGKEWITLKGRNVCPTAWWTIHGISKATFYRYKEMSKNGKKPEPHGNLGSKKPRMHTFHATATLKTILVPNADKMPHKTRTLESGEKVPAMVLSSAFLWSDQLPLINEANAALNLQPISSSGLSNIRQVSFPEYAPKARGDTFARCGLCDKYKQLRAACTPLSYAQEKWSQILDAHIDGQRAHRLLYYSKRHMSKTYPNKMLTIIHDKMDHSKTASPHFSHKTKATDSFMKMPVAVTSMIAHGQGDIRYAHYGLDIFPTDSNHTIGSIAKLLDDLEQEPKNSSRTLFSEEETQSVLTKAVLDGSDICLDSLLPPPPKAIPAHPLPPILTLQLDNASGDNKNRWVFAFCSLLVYRGIFHKVYINFLIVGHTHEDIDAIFGNGSGLLKTNNYPTLPMLVQSFMTSEKYPVIPHLIEEVPDFKRFVHGYIGTGEDFLEDHSRSQQFKFHMDSASGWPLMEYKNLCTDRDWLPEHGKGIRLWFETEDGLPKVPSGVPPPLFPRNMKALDEIKKGLNGFVAVWSAMANDRLLGDFKRVYGPIQEYWKSVRAALDAPLEPRATLLHDFWPTTKVIEEDEAIRQQREVMAHQEEAQDVPFVGRRRDRPRPSFNVNRDTFAGYSVVVHPADDDPKPFWLARAITNPNPDSRHMHMIEIQYWTPTTKRYINIETYDGWDTKKGNVWREDCVISPTWSNTDCVMTAWKPRIREGSSGPRVAIPKPQIDIIKASMVAFASDTNNDDLAMED